uniref:Uncharacterized protein n=1 Tax=Kwoniella bestiolae CBS 10118 TaxID=1296100 RepID=A0A1B9G988_9TREE|nr:hypothetical protein I302_02419 [Kwoniella bestiolae CBS 10118]OCF27576.1 hypothetical protein I302_02419 [Kwoniella bestiolae CBS 10118]
MHVYRLFQEQRQRQQAGANATAGPSISTHLLQQPQRPQQVQRQSYQGQIQNQPQPQPQFHAQPQPKITIDLTQDDLPVKAEPANQIRSTDSPMRLIPPGSSRTPSPIPHYPLSVQPAPSRKRSLVPIQANEPSNKAIKRTRASSSSIDPPVNIDNSNLLNELKPNVPSAPAAAPPAAADPISMKTIRPFLLPDALKQPRPVQLFKHLRKRENKKGDILPPLFLPTPKEVLEIVSALRNYASPEYLRAMADDERYCDVWSNWLVKCIKDIERWEAVIVPILQVLAKTDMPIDEIEDTKMRIRARKLVTIANEKNLASSSAIQSAFHRYDSYVVNVLIPRGRRSAPDEEEDEDSNNKKRKIDELSKDEIKPKIEAGPSKPPSSKIPATSSTINGSKAPIRPGSSSSNANATASSSKTGSKSATDMSFFGSNSASSSTSKPKSKLPDIKKKAAQPPPPAASGPASAVSNLLQQLKAGPVPVPNARPSVSDSSAPNQAGPSTENKKAEEIKHRYNAKGKLVRNVRFRDLVKPEEGGGALEQVKEFRQEAKEFEKFDAHDLDMDEGAALASARGHSMIEWYEPIPYNDETLIETDESRTQSARERETLALFNPPGTPTPDPSETDVRIVEGNNPTREMEPMNASEKILQYQSRGTYNPITTTNSALPQQDSIGNLLKGLSNIIPPQPLPQTYGGGFGYDSYSHGHNQQNAWNQQSAAGGYGNTNDRWNNSQNDYTRNYDNYNQSRDLRPVDRDPNVSVCRFWSRGE